MDANDETKAGPGETTDLADHDTGAQARAAGDQSTASAGEHPALALPAATLQLVQDGFAEIKKTLGA